MTNISVTDFEQEMTCLYCGAEYLVRDNGAILRKKQSGRRKRPLDEKWTFGNPCRHSGYMKLSTAVVHQVVATAFHGKPPSDQHVVDHIDTNRRNNRPENLRWVTRLENVLLNPATHKKIVAAYGSVEAFFENPQKPDIPRLLGQYDWMRTVSKEEALASRKRMERWAGSDKSLRGGSFGEWLFATENQISTHESEDQDIDSLTTGAIQRRWRTPCEFPACPQGARGDSLLAYKEDLTSGSVFSRNQYGESRAVSAEISQDSSALIVLCELDSNAVKPWANSRVTIEDGRFCHENLGSCFTLEGAEKQNFLARGLPWEGADSIDDYC
jgi:hypothetical protein